MYYCTNAAADLYGVAQGKKMSPTFFFFFELFS